MMNRDDITKILDFVADLTEKLQEQYNDNCFGDDHIVKIDNDIVLELLENDARFIGQGAYSTCYVTKNNEVLSVNHVLDSFKDDIIEFSDLPHMPKIDLLVNNYNEDYRLLCQPFVNVLEREEMTDEQGEIYDTINHYWQLQDIVDDILENDDNVSCLPQTLKDTLCKVNEFNSCLSLDCKPDNVGWDDDGQIVLFDLFLE